MDNTCTNPETTLTELVETTDATTPATIPSGKPAPSRRAGQRKSKAARPEAISLALGQYAAQQLVLERTCCANGDGKLATVEAWETLVKTLPSWLTAMPLPSIKPYDCERYFAELQARHRAGTLVEKTMAVRKRFLRSLLQRARQENLIDSNPCAALLLAEYKSQGRGAGPCEVTEEQTLSPDQMVRVLVVAACAVPPIFFVLVAVMLLTGMLGGEARALQLGDLQLDHCCGQNRRPRIWIRHIEHHGTLSPAGWEERYVDVPPVLEAILRWWISTRGITETQALLFPGPLPRKGSRRAERVQPGRTDWCVPVETLKANWERIRLHAVPGSKLSLTALRYAFSTISLLLGEDPLYVSLQVGHRTLRYTEKIFRKFINVPSQGAFAASTEDLRAALAPALQMPIQQPRRQAQTTRRARPSATPPSL